MGIHDTQPMAWGHSRGPGNRVKTSRHLCQHLRTQNRKERAYARGGRLPGGKIPTGFKGINIVNDRPLTAADIVALPEPGGLPS